MAAPISRLLVAVDDTRVVVRVCGRACFTCSSDFKKLVHSLHEKGRRSFALELSECTIMDSTFLGILARFAQVLSDGSSERGELALWNPSQRIVDLLDNLGVAHLFAVERGDKLAGYCCNEVPSGPQDKLQSTRDSLAAHQTLMEVNPENVAKFKDVVSFMAEDLKRIEQKRAKPA